MTPSTSAHPFSSHPHKTLLTMAAPALFSLAAEPLTGLVDTAFIARLGADKLAALGVGTAVLSTVLWAFNFLGIGSQTQVAQTLGAGDRQRAGEIAGITLLVAAVIGIGIAAILAPVVGQISSLMGAASPVDKLATSYIHIRLLAAPAVLITTAAFGVMRGLQDMKTPFKIAVAINVLNIGLDGALIFGWGPIPAMGIKGAAAASSLSQWIGALWAVGATFSQLGRPRQLATQALGRLFTIGRDLFIRTGLLTLFLLLSTRAATALGPDAGAAHQAVRQTWIFTALFLDAFAITGQSLIGFFIGRDDRQQIRHVAILVCGWSIVTAVVLSLGMFATTAEMAQILVPPSTIRLFNGAWWTSAAMLPLSAIAFATDGVHWGTGDFRFLRNGVIVATLCSAGALLILEHQEQLTLQMIWLVLAGWVTIRAVWGTLRIFPGIGLSPFKRSAKTPQHRVL